MKNKLVIWGSNAKDEKVLIAMELRPHENKVDIWTFPEAVVTEEFSNQMMNEWRTDAGEVAFPEEKTHIVRELMAADSLLPEDLKVERGDLIQRAQTEWHFIVLSAKLNQAYKTELDDLKEKVSSLTRYDGEMWGSLKTFWDKVQEQVKDRNLFREHADSLRSTTNELFDKLKDLRSSLDKEFESKSASTYNQFMDALEQVESKIASNVRVPSIFDDLKKLQSSFRESQFTKEHRSQVWERLDGAFKKVKEARFGASATQDTGSATDRLKSRLEGLLAAISKMESSIVRDKEDLDFQNKKISTTNGQLEAQIRQAKIVMIQERVKSKEEKLVDMLKTKGEIEKSMASQQERDAKRAEREQEKEKVKAAEEAVKGKIAQQIKVTTDTVDTAKVESAVEAVAATPVVAEQAAEPQALTIDEQIEDAVEDTIDTVKAITTVAMEKIGGFMNEVANASKDEPTKDA